MSKKIAVLGWIWVWTLSLQAQPILELIQKTYNADTRVLTFEFSPIFSADSFSIPVLYGPEANTTQIDTAYFYLEYENIPAEKQTLLLPSQISIQNLSKAYYPMPQGVYAPDEIDRKSTKTWKVQFSNIPENAGCMVFKAGTTFYQLDELALAEKARKSRFETFLKERKKKEFDYGKLYPVVYDSMVARVQAALTTCIQKFPDENYVGKMGWSIDTLGRNTFYLLDDTAKLFDTEKFLFEKFKNDSFPVATKYGIPVLSKWEFHVLKYKGSSHINLKEIGSTYKPSLPNEEVKSFIKKQLTENRRYHVAYAYSSVNGLKNTTSYAQIRKTFLTKEQQNVFLFGTFVALGIGLAILLGGY